MERWVLRAVQFAERGGLPDKWNRFKCCDTNNNKMPDLVLNGGMIEMLTDPALYRQAMANYYAQQRAKRAYYENHKEEILAKKRQKYAAEHPEVKKKRKDPAE